MALDIEAPCKINLHLKIGGKRADGFHSLESIFAALALGDSLRIRRAGSAGALRLSVDWEIPGEEIPAEKNLVSQAVSLFRERTGFSDGLDIRLVKRVPAGAGLGGGSSDAASTLRALNALSGAALGPGELAETAALLGSDVPFFLEGGLAFAEGRGEVIEPLRAPPAFFSALWVVVAKPGFSSDTAAAFRLLDRARENPGRVEREPLSRERLAGALGGDPPAWPFYNDFLDVFLESGGGEYAEKAAAYRFLLETLRNSGAVFSGLSGSGSACYGVFNSRAAALGAKKILSRQEIYSRMTFFLANESSRY